MSYFGNIKFDKIPSEVKFRREFFMAKKEIQKRLLLCAAAFIFGIAFVFAGSLTACNDVSDKIEILEEPKMTMGSNDFFGYFPVISVKIRNKTNSIINVGIDCTIYDKYGRHTQKISSLYFGVDAGDTVTLWAKSNLGYSSWEYSTKCAEFEVEYKFLNG